MFKLLVGLFRIRRLLGLSNNFVNKRWLRLLFDKVLMGVIVCFGGNKKFCK